MLTEEELINIRSEVKPTMEVRRFLGKGLEELQENTEKGTEMALFRLKLLTEAWQSDKQSDLLGLPSLSAHSSATIRQTLRGCFFSQGFYYEAYEELLHRNRVDGSLRGMAAELAQDILKPAERGANNRSFFFALGHARAARLFPQLPEARVWSTYAEAVWQDWYEPGDCYEPGYVAHNIKQVIELGLILGKNEELKSSRALAAFRRYRDHISPSGLAIQPGDGGNQSAYVDALALMAEVTGDGMFLWAATQAFLAGEYGGYYNAKGGRLPAETAPARMEAKFEKFRSLGIIPTLPPGVSGVQEMYPQTYRIPDRLLLNSSRELGKPYAAFYLNDRMETLHHAHEDNRGDLYHYEVDGVMYMKRSGWQKWAGHSSSFVVDDATSEFPFCYTQGLLSGHWYKASSNLRMLRDFIPSERVQPLYRTPETFRHTGEQVDGDETMMPLPHFFVDQESPYGVHLSNPEGMAGHNEKLTVRSVTLSINTFLRGGSHRFPKSMDWYRDYREVVPADGPIEMWIRDIHLSGPKGKLRLTDIASFLDHLEVTFYEDGKKGTLVEKRLLSQEEIRQWITLGTDERTGTPALKVICQPGRMDLTWSGFQEEVHLTEEYHRIGFDYLYVSDVRDYLRTPIRIFVNGITCRSLYTDHQQGGILKEAVVNECGNDSFGSMAYEGVYTYDSTWTRQTLLTEEGYLLVVDRFKPGMEADGMVGGPVWQMNRPEAQGLFWFDGTADAELGKKLLIYFHPQRGRQYGVQFQPKLWDDKSYAVYSKAVMKAGREETFVSIMIPHESSVSGAVVSGKENYHAMLIHPEEQNKGVVSEIGTDGTVRVGLQLAGAWEASPINIEIHADGSWNVSRAEM